MRKTLRLVVSAYAMLLAANMQLRIRDNVLSMLSC